MDDQEHRRKVEAVFRKHDADNSGTIDGSELVTALSALNALPDGSPEAQRKFVDDLLARVEPDDDDAATLTLSEFQKLFDLGRVRAAFHAVDTDGSGNATAAEVAAMLRRLGVPGASIADAKRFIEKVDTSGDGTIDLAEFERAFEFVPLASLQAVAARWAALGALPECGGGDLGSATIPVPGLRTWQTVMAGGIGGVASKSVVAPLERVRLAQQTGKAEGLGLFGLMRNIVAAEGWRGLWAGNGTACIRVFPTGAITCTSYVNLLQLTPADEEIDAMEVRAPCGNSWRLSDGMSLVDVHTASLSRRRGSRGSAHWASLDVPDRGGARSGDGLWRACDENRPRGGKRGRLKSILRRPRADARGGRAVRCRPKRLN